MEDWVSVRAGTTQRELEEIVEELSCKLTCFTYEQIWTKNVIVYQQFSLIFGRKFPHTHAQKILHKNGMRFFNGKTTTAYSQHCINFKSEEKAKAFYCFSIYSFVCYFTFFSFYFSLHSHSVRLLGKCAKRVCQSSSQPNVNSLWKCASKFYMCKLYGKSAGLNAYFNFYYMIQRENGRIQREWERTTKMERAVREEAWTGKKLL